MTEESRTNRISNITEAVQKALEGDFSCRIDMSDEDNELGMIANAFNQLIHRLDKEIIGKNQIEAALRDSEEKYRRLKANIPGMVYVFAMHPDGTYSFPFHIRVY